MILGIGIDLVDIFRINKILEKYPGQFAKRVLGKRELSTYENILFSDVRAKERAKALQSLTQSELHFNMNDGKKIEPS